MKKILLALALALAAPCLTCPAPAYAFGVQIFPPDLPNVTGALSNSGDTVTLPITGGQWATAKVAVNGVAGTATITAQVSIDGGKNYFAAAYGKQQGVVAPNPTVKALTAVALATGDIWEIALPGNVTHLQLICAGTGTTTSVTLSGGALYVSGVPVTAVLYDASSSTGVANSTGVLDMSGWSYAIIRTRLSATTVQTLSDVLDAGGTDPLLTTATQGNSTFSVGGPSLAPSSASLSTAQKTRRMQFDSAALVGATNNIRWIAFR